MKCRNTKKVQSAGMKLKKEEGKKRLKIKRKYGERRDELTSKFADKYGERKKE